MIEPKDSIYSISRNAQDDASSCIKPIVFEQIADLALDYKVAPSLRGFSRN